MRAGSVHGRRVEISRQPGRSVAAENVCEHGDHSSPEGMRFCSRGCVRCERESKGESGCDGICRRVPWLVGEDNPYGSDPRYALWCEPRRSAGGRLCFDVLGLESKRVYFRNYHCVNLCSGKWSTPDARLTATALLNRPPTTFVLLGAKVARAFGVGLGVDDVPYYSSLSKMGHTVAVLPHPSGRNRMWNEPFAVERARETLRFIGAL